jgi:hypothetical protein
MTGRAAELRIAVALSAIGFVLAGLGASVAVLARDLNQPTDRLGLLASAFAVGLLVIAVIGPRLLRSLSITTMLTIGSLVSASGVVLLALAPSYAVAITGGLCVGVGGASLVLVAPLMLDGPLAAKRLSRVNAVASATGILAPVAIGAVDALGVTGRLALLAAVPPLVVLAAVTGMQALPPPAGQLSSGPPLNRSVVVAVSLGWLRVVLAVGVEFCFVVWAVARLLAAGLPMATAALAGSAFPIGMAVGRAIGPIHWRGWSPVVPGGVLAIVGTLLVSLFASPVVVTIGLVVAGAGVAPLYPVTVAALVAMPGLGQARLAAIGAMASGTAILVVPAALAAVAGVVDVRTAYLITLPLIAVLFALSRRRRYVTPDQPLRRDELHVRRGAVDHRHHAVETQGARVTPND